MAIFGAQLVFSLIIFSFLQKLSPFFSFGRWLLSGRLVRYLHPTDDDLKTAAGIPQGGTKGKSKRTDYKKGMNGKPGTFTIPRNTPLQLDTAPVEPIDLIQLHYYSDYIWLMDFSICALVVYLLTEIYNTFQMRNEMNISILWCLMAVVFCIRILLAQTALYFRSEEGGERIMCVTFGFFFLVAAMGVLVVDESVLEFGLQTGYSNFSDGAQAYLQQQGIESHGPVSFLTFRIILAFVCSILGALLTFPGLRYAKLHLDALKFSRENYLMQTVLHVNFILPIILVAFWIKPVARDMLCGKHWTMTSRIMSETVFDVLRIFIFFLMAVLRLVLLKTHLQSHLNLAYEKIEKLKKESGRISNVEIQKTVTSVFFYLIMVALQYLTPVVLLVFMGCLQKTLGGYSWSAMLGEDVENYVSSFQVVKPVITQSAVNATDVVDNILDKASQFTLAFSDLRQVFTHVWYRGLLSYLSWWMCSAWFVSTSFGMYYYSRIEQ